MQFFPKLAALGALLVTGIFAAPANHAAAEETDFDQDGRSDLTVVIVRENGSLAWRARRSGTGTMAQLGDIGSNGDDIIIGNWLNTTVPEVGVAFYRPAAKSIVWQIRDEQGGAHERLFGAKGNTVVSGADFNGDGITDGAVVRKKGRTLSWIISYDLFVNPAAPQGVQEIRFGGPGDQPFFISYEGGNDWLAIATKGKNGKPVVRVKNTLNGRVRTITRIPRWSSSRRSLRPIPLGQSGASDLLVFARQRQGITDVEFRTIAGVKLATSKIASMGDLVVGDYLDAPGQEIALKGAASDSFTALNPYTLLPAALAARTGIAVDSININVIGRGSSSGGSTGGGNNGGGNNGGGTTPGAPVSNCEQVRSWPSSHIYKTIGSDHFSPSDPRRNSAGVVVRPGGSGPFPSCLEVMDTRGNVLARMGLYARGGEWAARFYAGFGCGASTAYGGAAIGAAARRNTGSPNVVINFGSVCYGPIDATECIGSSQC